MFGWLGDRLYLRIWLAVLGAVVLFTLAVGWAWRMAAENAAANAPRPPREVIVRNGGGEVIGTAQARPLRLPDGSRSGLEFNVQLRDGSTLLLEMPPRPRPPGAVSGSPGGPGGAQRLPPLGFGWMLLVVAIAIAVGTYPVVRRLTKRLETLERGVQRLGEGDLSARVQVQGHDEVASLARQFNRSAARIEALVQAHKGLLANASHELRSPLARIRMGLELLGSGAPEAQRRELARNVAELDQLIDEILLASRLDSPNADIGATESVDLLGLAAEECARVDAELDAQPGPHAALPELVGSARLLRRALRNLLENARRYSPPESRVALHIDRASPAPDAGLRVRVCDNGPGVPLEHRERIFEPFWRLPGASEREGGVGLGLALVRSIAERHGGTVRCENPVAGSGFVGACFVLELPLRPPVR